jgi:hypothetical protein
MHRVHKAWLLAAATVLAIVPVALASSSPAPPTVTTAAATSVTDTGATLNGTVNPGGRQTQYAFQWGPTAVLSRSAARPGDRCRHQRPDDLSSDAPRALALTDIRCVLAGSQ